MPEAGMGSVSHISQIAPADFLGLPAPLWFWLAVAGWAAAILLATVVIVRSERGARTGELWPETPAVERVELDTPAILRAITPDEDAVGGVLRWLLNEADADAVALLELSPQGEALRIEPRGLDGAAVAGLAELTRRSLLGLEEPADEVSVVRWLGSGGTNVLVAIGTAIVGGREPFRFSRYLLEWVRTTERRERPQGELEDRLRRVAGVAWAEVLGESVRLLPTEDSNVELARRGVERELEGTGIVAEWVEVEDRRAIEAWGGGALEPAAPESPAAELSQLHPGASEPAAERIPAGVPVIEEKNLVTSAIGNQEPRIRLLDVALSGNGEATADVRVGWNEREIRGRGHGRGTRAGRYFAAAQAVADALRPLLDTDVVVEGLYVATTKEGVDVLISEVRMEGERFVGAVLERRDESDWTGARAVLDAVNRRLAQLAGRSGRV